MLENKKILIISPDRWRDLHVSKHHYAIELEKRNNEIYFLNPVEPGTPFFKINKIIGHQKIHSVDFNTTIRAERFLNRQTIRLIERFQIKLFLFLLKTKIDIVWCFSDFSFRSLDLLNSDITIFHPVDMMMSGGGTQAEHSDIVFSVAENIIDKYKPLNKPMYEINHGLADIFSTKARQNTEKYLLEKYYPNNPLKVGYAGNLLRPDIDHKIFLDIINQNTDVRFYLWGPYEYKSVNLEYDKKKHVEDFINALKNSENVELCGLCKPEILADQMQNMDMFLICYDPQKEINQCSNNHKIMEYFSTGKCIVSNHIMSYKNHKSIVVMPDSLDNRELPKLFTLVKTHIMDYNSTEKMRQRINFSLENTYQKKIDHIDEILHRHFSQASR